MRVLFLIRSLAGIGGAERAVLELAAAMVARGHSATVATHDSASGASFYPVPEGVDLVRLAFARPEAAARHENAPPSPDTEPRKKKKPDDGSTETVVEEPSLTPSSAEQALERIALPEKLKQRISRLITPGSTIIIADKGYSRETGKGTDFIILTK